MILKRLAIAFVVVAAALGLTVAANGTASARPAPALTWAVNGDHFWVNTGKCRGDVRISLTTDRAKPGTVNVRFQPSRFTRTCSFHVWAGWGPMLPDQIRVPMTAGPRGGKVVNRTYRTGSGPQALGFGHRQSLSSVSFYTWVP